MTRSFASPFLRPREDAVYVSPWLLTGEKGAEPLKDPLPEWDYSVDLPLSRKVRVDAGQFLRDCHLKAGSRIALVVHMMTGDAGIRQLVHREIVELGDAEPDRELHVETLLNGRSLQGKLELDTRVVLVDGFPESTLAPREPGSRLWEDVCRFQLEGGGGRLPMEAAGFRDVRPEYGRAPWFLDVEITDLDASLIGACRVVLNLNRDDIILAVEQKNSTVLSLLSADLVRHVASTVIEMDEFAERRHDYEEGTLGAAVSHWLNSAFGEKSLDEVQAIKQGDPARFEAIIASAFGGNHGAD